MIVVVAASSVSNSVPIGHGLARRSPSSNISTTFLAAWDGELSKQASACLPSRAWTSRWRHGYAVEKSGDGAKVVFEPVKGGAADDAGSQCRADLDRSQAHTLKVSVCRGRRVLDSRGRVEIDGHYQDECRRNLCHP